MSIALFALMSCSSTTTTTKTDVKRRPVDQEYIEETTTETKTEESSSCGGILTCTIDGIGTILGLPFRIVGGLFDIIF